MAASQEQTPENSIEPIFTVKPAEAHLQTTPVAWLPDDRLVRWESECVEVWNVTNRTLELGDKPMIHRSQVKDIVTTKDGRIILHTSDGKPLMIWNVETRKVVDGPRSKEYFGPIRVIVLSNSEELLASCHKKWIVLWDMVGTMQIRSCIDLESIGCSDMTRSPRGCFSRDGKRFAYEFRPNVNKWMIVVLDVESGKPILGPLAADSFTISSVVWALDGARLVCGCRGGEICCLDSRTGETMGKPWTGHENSVRSLSLSPDGKSLASGSNDRTIRLWNVESSNPGGGPIYTLYHDSRVSQVAFSRSGKFIAGTGNTGNISVWRVPWWDDDRQQAFDPLLDLSAVVSPDSGPSNGPREPDLPFPDVSVPRPRRSGVNPSDDTPRMQSSARSWRWWKKIPRLVFDRSNPIHMARGPSRVHVASRDDVHNSPPPPTRRTDDNSPAESNSGDSSDESTSDTLEVGGVGCCGLLSRPRTRATPGQRAVPVELSAVTTRPLDANTPIATTSRPVPQDILDLPAVIPSS